MNDATYRAELKRSVSAEDWDDAHVFWLGDYVDKGPDSRAVIEWLSTVQTNPAVPQNQKHHFIMGNHEFACVSFLGLGESGTVKHAEETGPRGHFYRGPGSENMGLQGKRWGGFEFIDTYTSTTTFDSYDVHPQKTDARSTHRADLLANMPQHHKDFLYNLDWVCEVDTNHGKIITVHAGFLLTEGGQFISGQTQIEFLQQKDWSCDRIKQFSERDLVCWPPADLVGSNEAVLASTPGYVSVKRDGMPDVRYYGVDKDTITENLERNRGGKDAVFIVSGHHGFQDIRHYGTNRIIVDTCAGKNEKKLSAIVLPSHLVVSVL